MDKVECVSIPLWYWNSTVSVLLGVKNSIPKMLNGIMAIICNNAVKKLTSGSVKRPSTEVLKDIDCTDLINSYFFTRG